MAKDSQIDPKEVRMKKCNGQTPLTSEEGKNHNRTSKKHSIKSEGYGNHWQSPPYKSLLVAHVYELTPIS